MMLNNPPFLSKQILRQVFVFMCYFAASWANAQFQLTLYPDQITVRSEYAIRLDQMLKSAMQQAKSSQLQRYPIGNQLYDLKQQDHADQLKQQVLTQLKQLSKQDPKKQSIFSRLRQQIQHWQVGVRLFIPLDYDLVRIDPRFNPFLDGQYQLVISQQLTKVAVFGLVSKPEALPLQPQQTVKDYVLQAQPLSDADPSYAWIIYPDGQAKQVGYAYWNNENINLIGGATLFLGFNDKRQQLQQLEKQIVELMQMRKVM